MPRPRNFPPAPRLACDRCHAQKQKCRRPPGENRCSRCVASSYECIFSPRQQRRSGATACASAVDGSGISTTGEEVATGSGNHDTRDAIFHESLINNDEEGNNPDIGADPVERLSLFHDEARHCSAPGTQPATGSFQNDITFANQFASAGMSMAHADVGMDLDSGSLGFGLEPFSQPLLGLRPDSLLSPDLSFRMPNLDVEAHAAGTLTPSSSAVSVDDHLAAGEAAFDGATYVRKLANLNVQLFEHAEALPPVNAVPLDRLPSLDGRVFAIDKTFQMTQSLIDILKFLYPSSSTGTPATNADFPDESTVLLIMSCSNRVFGIYETIFAHMHRCITHSITPVGKDGKTILLPELRIGSFTPPTPSAIAMQMLLIVMMAAEFFDQLQEALGVWRHGRRHGANSQADGTDMDLTCTERRLNFPNFTDDVKMKMAQRAGLVSEEIVSARKLLLDIPGVKGGMGWLSHRNPPHAS